MDLSSIDPTMAANLEAPFEEDEIRCALMEVEGDKAPGPDGFPFHFAQSFWSLFREDILGLFRDFHSTTEFDHWFSESFISLIPKNQGRSSVNDFRPISHLGWVHKRITQVLTTKLCSVMDSLLSFT